MKTHGPREVPLPASLIITIKKYQKLFKTKLALCKVSDPDKAMSSAGLSMYLKGIFGCSVCVLRKIYISQKILDNEDMTIQERKRIANIMAHTLSSQEFLYSCFSIKIK